MRMGGSCQAAFGQMQSSFIFFFFFFYRAFGLGEGTADGQRQALQLSLRCPCEEGGEPRGRLGNTATSGVSGSIQGI